jgi:hypothetical protein
MSTTPFPAVRRNSYRRLWFCGRSAHSFTNVRFVAVKVWLGSCNCLDHSTDGPRHGAYRVIDSGTPGRNDMNVQGTSRNGIALPDTGQATNGQKRRFLSAFC